MLMSDAERAKNRIRACSKIFCPADVFPLPNWTDIIVAPPIPIIMASEAEIEKNGTVREIAPSPAVPTPRPTNIRSTSIKIDLMAIANTEGNKY